MNFPGRSQRGADIYDGVARSQQLSTDTTREGIVDDGSIAFPERVDLARRTWLEASVDDYEKIGRRRYRDRASGIELVAVRGAVLLGVGGEQQARGVSCFFVEDGRLVFLRREDHEAPLLGPVGHVVERRLETAPAPIDGEMHVWFRRLLKTNGHMGLYEIRDEYGRRQEWLALPGSDYSDPAATLLAASTPKSAALAGGLYGDPPMLAATTSAERPRTRCWRRTGGGAPRGDSSPDHHWSHRCRTRGSHQRAAGPGEPDDQGISVSLKGKGASCREKRMRASWSLADSASACSTQREALARSVRDSPAAAVRAFAAVERGTTLARWAQHGPITHRKQVNGAGPLDAFTLVDLVNANEWAADRRQRTRGGGGSL